MFITVNRFSPLPANENTVNEEYTKTLVVTKVTSTTSAKEIQNLRYQ